MSRLPTTIYRPAVVTGNWSTGNRKYDGPYYVLLDD